MTFFQKKIDDSEDDEPAKEYSCEFVVQHGVKELRDLENTFIEELTKSLSLKVDLRTYEEFVVKTDDGKVGLSEEFKIFGNSFFLRLKFDILCGRGKGGKIRGLFWPCLHPSPSIAFL